MGYGPSRLFPGYDGTAMEIEERSFITIQKACD